MTHRVIQWGTGNINAIPAVCAHAKGLISTLDLPYTPTTNISEGQH